MPVIAVVNRKGGSGKSTLATHLAAWCAHQGIAVMLGDADRQQSTQVWLRRRARGHAKATVPAVMGWAVEPAQTLHVPSGVTHAVLDTPGGMQGFPLARVANHADAIVIPVCNSAFDREATAAGWAELKAMPRVSSGRCRVAVVGMRLDSRTKADAVLRAWAEEQGLPYLGALRETQMYVRCVERGLSIFDLPEPKARDDLAQWAPILDWLQPSLWPETAADSRARESVPPSVQQGDAPPPIRHTMPKVAPPVLKPTPAPSLAQRMVSWLKTPLLPRADKGYGALDASTLRELRSMR